MANKNPKCNSKKGQHNIGRPPSSHRLMVKAMANRDIKELYWAFLTLSVNEIRNGGALTTFSGNHVVAMLDSLQKLNTTPEAEDKTLELQDWLQNKNKVS